MVLFVFCILFHHKILICSHSAKVKSVNLQNESYSCKSALESSVLSLLL